MTQPTRDTDLAEAVGTATNAAPTDTRPARPSHLPSSKRLRRGQQRPAGFVAAVFVSAMLLFAVQPLATRMVLPDFGGSAAVWTTSVLFFQTALLLGYLYTHVATNHLRPLVQIRVHLVLYVLPLIVLPLSVKATPGDGGTGDVVLRLLAGLAVGVGGPFLLVSTSGPLLQRWFSWTDHARARDPYFLYAASNVGSILGLVTYPVLVEPLLDLQAQAVVWAVGYVTLGVLLVVCAAHVAGRRTLMLPVAGHPRVRQPDAVASGSVDATSDGLSVATDSAGAARPAARQVATWVGLAFLPSSLMLGTTTFLSTDIAAAPLLWVAPLALYLGTFVIAFGARATTAARWALHLVAATTLIAGIAVVTHWPVPLLIVLVLAAFALLAMVLHGRLAASRPPAEQLTAFYLWMSVGGALGGVFNGIVAPLLLPGPFEYPIVMVVAALVVGSSLLTIANRSAARFALASMIIIVGTLGLDYATIMRTLTPWLLAVATIGYVAWLLVTGAGRSKIAIAAAMILLAGPVAVPYMMGGDRVARSFFGSYRVVTSGHDTTLFSGTTVHGIQSDDPSRQGALSYFHPEGPLGDWLPATAPDARIGVVGLGAGSIAAYGQPGQVVRFHEIDPTVELLARSEFDFLDEARSRTDVVIGDGRLTLQDVPRHSYDVLVIDAFTSDSIPVHLLTREAFVLYDEVLARDGVLLLHISNRYLDLRPVVAAGTDAIGLDARVGEDNGDMTDNRAASVWMAATRSRDALRELDETRWSTPPPTRIAWTDDSSNLVQVFAR